MRYGVALVGFLVGDDADGVAADPGVAAEEGAAEVGLVFVELAAIDDAGDDFAHVVDVACAGCGIEQGVKVFGGVAGRVAGGVEGAAAEEFGSGSTLADFLDEGTQAGEAEMVVGLFKVDGAGDFSVHGCAAEFFRVGFLADGGLHQRRAGEKESGAFGHEDGVGHDGEIRAPGDAHSHDGGDLGNAHGAHDGVVAEDSAEVVGVGEDVFLEGQKDAGGVDQVERGDAVLHGDGLGAENLFGGHGEEGAGFYGGVVGDDHRQSARDAAEAGDDACGRRAAVVGIHAVRGPQAEFQKLGAGIEEQVEALANRQATLGVLGFGGLCAAALPDSVLG